jgi:putative phosphoesterase
MRPEALAALAEFETVIHAGDVGGAEILGQLRKGPAGPRAVHTVRGNTDYGTFGAELPRTEVLEAGDVGIYVLHIPEEIDLSPATAGFSVVIHGHTHRPRNEWIGSVLYLNPGSAGPRRFDLPVTVAHLTIDPPPGDIRERVRAEIIELDVPPARSG